MSTILTTKPATTNGAVSRRSPLNLTPWRQRRRTLIQCLAAFAMLAAGARESFAQCAATWVQVSTNGIGPREEGGLVYDASLGHLFYRAGEGNGVFYDDTDQWNGTAWMPVGTGGPSPRRAFGMAYDADRQRTVLFGGEKDGIGIFSDTWEWNGTTWAHVTNSGPGNRWAHSMVYDSVRHKCVMFGGQATFFGPLSQDTWEWDGVTWTRVATTGPSPREDMGMTFDSLRGKVVLFGGYDGTTNLLRDTWEWDGATWIQAASAGPAPRAAPGTTFDPVRGRTVLFGGYTVGAGLSFLGDTWEWDGLTWTPLTAAGPSPRFAKNQMCYDSSRGEIILFGGGRMSDGTDYADTWALRTTPVLTSQPGNMTVTVNNAAAFSVRTDAGVGTLTYRWRHNGTVLNDSGRIFGAMSPNLFVFPVQTDDAGAYDVEVANDCGMVVSHSATLAIARPCCPGDLNDDGHVDGLDVQPFVTRLMTANGGCP